MLPTLTLTLPHIPAERFTLENGLRVVLSEDHGVPVVSVAVYYDVGSRNEKPGRTGFAHLFEHMMFQGSENVAKAAHFQYIFNSGGTMNGTTSTERTNYFETLPANQLPLALWLESDRMRSLKVTQENLDNQREAVKEEKRLTYDNRPYSNAFLRLNELVYQNPANAHSTIGSMEDLDAATLEDVQEFFRIYYAPNNAVLTLVGDFDPHEARALIEKYFTTIPRQPPPPPIDVSEPAGVTVRHEVYHDRFAQLPALMIGWKAPARRTENFHALTLAIGLLLEGDSSRLYQRLVKGDESVIAVQGGIGERRGPSSLYMFAIPKPGHDSDEVQATINEEIKRLAEEGPTAHEMEKLRNGLMDEWTRGHQSSMFRAQRLSEYALYDGDPSLFNTDLENYLDVTAEDIKHATALYLVTDNRVLIEIVPSSKEGTISTDATDERAALAKDAPSPAASSQPVSEPEQPGAPPAQVPPSPPVQPASTTEPPTTPVTQPEAHPEVPRPPAETPQLKG